MVPCFLCLGDRVGRTSSALGISVAKMLTKAPHSTSVALGLLRSVAADLGSAFGNSSS